MGPAAVRPECSTVRRRSWAVIEKKENGKFPFVFSLLFGALYRQYTHNTKTTKVNVTHPDLAEKFIIHILYV